MRSLSRILFAAYLFMLLWLVLFKFSYDPAGVLREFQIRSFNLVPFTRAHKSEMISNFVAFVPFGVLLGVNLKSTPFAHKIATIFAFSLAVEIIQYTHAIGVADITDLITNTLGGLAGLAAYTTVSRYANSKYLDGVIIVAGSAILLVALYLRIFVFIVKY